MSTGLVSGAGIVAVVAIVVGVIGLVYGLLRHHRKLLAQRTAERARAAAQVAQHAVATAAQHLPTPAPSTARTSS
jgi:uncharacterized membrane protein